MNKIKEALEEVISYALVGCTLGAIYIGTTIAVNTTLLGFRFPVEFAQKKLFNETKKEYKATLKNTGYFKLAQTKGRLDYGDFELENGDIIRINDSARVLEGKLFENTRLPNKKEIGKTYDLKIIGSEKTGYSLLEAREN